MLTDLSFSVDSTAHLRKIAESTFREKEYYLVELIRSAVKRHATDIRITLSNRKAVIKDNGHGLNEQSFDRLINTVSSEENGITREDHISYLTENSRLGLLSVFSPKPTVITIKSLLTDSTADEGTFISVTLKGRQVHKTIERKNAVGTEITLIREVSDIKLEHDVLIKYLTRVEPSVPFTVSVNGNPVVYKGSLSKCMIKDEFKTETGYRSVIGIPVQGEICRVCVTDHDIPWSVEMYYPVKGCIFDVVIESSDNPGHRDYSDFIKKVLDLYHWLAERYERLPFSHQTRIRELIQMHQEKDRESGQFHDVKVYRTVEGELYSLDTIVQYSEESSLSYINTIQFNAGGFFPDEKVFVFSNRDVDFLSNTMKIPLNRVDSVSESDSIQDRMSLWVNRTRNGVLNRFDILFEKRIVSPSTKEETMFLHSMTDLFKDLYGTIQFTDQKGFGHFHIKQNKHNAILCIHLNHPVTRSILSLVAGNSEYRILAWHLYNTANERRKNRQF